MRSDCESCCPSETSVFSNLSAVCVLLSDSPHCEPPLVEEPAPETVSVSRNSEDGACNTHTGIRAIHVVYILYIMLLLHQFMKSHPALLTSYGSNRLNQLTSFSQ